jgi:DNA recombination protein RmuC
VPSESIFAELNERFRGSWSRKSHRARVVIVSPSLLMLSIQVIQSVLRDAKDARTGSSHSSRGRPLDCNDVGRLNDRVGKLQSHFAQANKDIDQILISSDKISKRSRKIEDLELGEASSGADPQGDDAPQLAMAPDR